jgi:hypothetical protein
MRSDKISERYKTKVVPKTVCRKLVVSPPLVGGATFIGLLFTLTPTLSHQGRGGFIEQPSFGL